MGRPFACECAFQKCNKVRDDVEQPGIFFDQQQLFLQPLSGSCLQELWACCQEHRLKVLEFTLKDMPHHPRLVKEALEGSFERLP
ncbi:hypothetical protein WJX74_000252 [Apatococcus lobatus]|uniref:Uncharacterized protein n=2 Tax=Apatococcus TaxID=904362 RepID=A0AAW1SMM2_9CHLO